MDLTCILEQDKGSAKNILEKENLRCYIFIKLGKKNYKYKFHFFMALLFPYYSFTQLYMRTSSN